MTRRAAFVTPLETFVVENFDIESRIYGVGVYSYDNAIYKFASHYIFSFKAPRVSYKTKTSKIYYMDLGTDD